MNLELELQDLQTRVATLEAQMSALLEHFGVMNRDGDGLQDEIMRLVRANQKIEAIKRYRERTGASLLEAKNYVEGLRL
jgi:ribosomal protein L7/L12